MKKILSILAILSIISCKNQEESIKSQSQRETKKSTFVGESIHQFTVKDINGNDFNFASLRGKKILVVNTASQSGLVSQYEQLQALYEEFGKDKFVVVAFPSNDFQNQEPGTNAEIAEFCKKNYKITFPIMEKTVVKGENMSPVYKFLTQRLKNGIENSDIEWSFQKYLLDEEGQLVKGLPAQIVPIDDSIISWIKS
jgi:glutathione peroxidase